MTNSDNSMPQPAGRPVASCALSRTEAKLIIRIIGEYQTLLESSIDAMLVPGTNKSLPEEAGTLRQERRRWREAENMVFLLDQRTGRKVRA